MFHNKEIRIKIAYAKLLKKPSEEHITPFASALCKGKKGNITYSFFCQQVSELLHTYFQRDNGSLSSCLHLCFYGCLLPNVYSFDFIFNMLKNTKLHSRVYPMKHAEYGMESVRLKCHIGVTWFMVNMRTKNAEIRESIY